jgi:hypothetical protein
MQIVSQWPDIVAELRTFETIGAPKIGAPQFVMGYDKIVTNASRGLR